MSNETAQLIDKEIRRVVDSGYDRAKTLLTDNEEQLHMLAKALLEYETLSGDEIKTILEGGTVDRGHSHKPVIPTAGSSIPKSRKPKAGFGDAAPAGA